MLCIVPIGSYFYSDITTIQSHIVGRYLLYLSSIIFSSVVINIFSKNKIMQKKHDALTKISKSVYFYFDITLELFRLSDGVRSCILSGIVQEKPDK